MTVPVGVPAPGATAATAALKVTGCPNTDGAADELTAEHICPALLLRGAASRSSENETQPGRRVGHVTLLGVDDRFWTFHGVTAVRGPAGREAYVSPALARELGASSGDALLLRVQKPSAIPLESLHGRKEDVGKSIRLLMSGVARREFAV